MAEVRELLEQLKPYLAQSAEVQLADFGETAAGGPYAKFRYPDPEDIGIFRGKDRASKAKGGSRYWLFLIEIMDDEQVVNQEQKEKVEEAQRPRPKGGALSKNAAQLCKEPMFQKYAAKLLERSSDYGLVPEQSEDTARSCILHFCKIESRAELDSDPQAAEAYERLRGMYLRALRANGYG